jgi:prophage regulatory protein
MTSIPRRCLRRLPWVSDRTGSRRSTIYKQIGEGLLPPPVDLGGGRAVAWPDDEIDAVVDARIAGKTNDEIRVLVRQLVERRKRLESSLEDL